MAQLIPKSRLELAWFASPNGGNAEYTIDNSTPGGGSPTVEVWERVIPWSNAISPPFTFVDKFTNLTEVSRPVPPMGGLYQCRLYFVGQGNASGTGAVLAKLDFPCLARAARTNMLTRCASVPQIEIKLGGTFVSMAFATAVPTMVRIQLGSATPGATTTAVEPGSFAPQDVVARATSEVAKLLHKITLTDNVLPGDIVFFTILAWDAAGNWDFIWNTTGIAPISLPESMKLKRRKVSVRLAKLHVFEDSDDLSDGEGEFKLVVSQAGASQTKSFSSGFKSGQSVTAPPSMSVDIGPQSISPATHGVLVRVDGAEDDSGFPWLDDNDEASTTLTLGSGGNPLSFPVGEGTEEVHSDLLWPSKMKTSGEVFSFLAEVHYDVSYVI
jgi:hypothetical protein